MDQDDQPVTDAEFTAALGLDAADIHEARRAHALELATELHAARERAGKGGMLGGAFLDGEVIDTANRFVDYLRTGQ